MTQVSSIEARAVLLALLYALPHCASRQRPAEGTRVRADGTYIYAGDQSHGCDGQVISAERHHQVALGGGVTHVDDDGLRGGARATAIVGFPGEVSGFEVPVDRSRYVIGIASGHVGWSSRYFGVEAGATVLFPLLDDPPILPGGSLLFGDINRGWLDVSVLHPDRLHDGELAAIGWTFATDKVRARGGVGFWGRPFLGVTGDTMAFATWYEHLDFGASADVIYDIDESWGVGGRVVLGPQPSFGLSLTFRPAARSESGRSPSSPDR